MLVQFRDGSNIQEADLPLNPMQLEDLLDRLDRHKRVRIVIPGGEVQELPLPEMFCDREMEADIYELNLLAERIYDMEPDEFAAFGSLFYDDVLHSVREMLDATEALGTVSVWEAEDNGVLDLVMHEHLLPELEGCSPAIYRLLDTGLVADRLEEMCGLVQFDDYYCDISHFKMPEHPVEVPPQMEGFFRVWVRPTGGGHRCTATPADPMVLPCDDDALIGMECSHLESRIPMLSGCVRRPDFSLSELNALAKQLDQLGHDDFIKLKAVASAEGAGCITAVCAIMDRLPHYEFDHAVHEPKQYAARYLTANWDMEQEVEAMPEEVLDKLGWHLLEQKHGTITPYGMISCLDGSLYTRADLQAQEETQACEQTEEGVISL